ncbi:MAG: bifunctional adenosylcobinamide kinase/adenosylcobinamide-phosphate guanylyltransferase [Limnochordia bacterium]
MTSEAWRGLILVLGGARSGKSAAAERLVADSGLPVTYIATAHVGDDEMRERIIRHRQHRPKDWTTIEAPVNVHEVINDASPRAYLIDCLTLYLSNCLMDPKKEGLSPASLQKECLSQVDSLIEAAERCPGLVVIVSNEVGQGIVPAYPLGRLFRDVAGWANQRVAAAAREVFYCVAGIPVELKRLQRASASTFLTGDMPGREESDD